MAPPPPPPQSWADAPPYHYHGTPLPIPLPHAAPPPPPQEEEEAAGGGGAATDGARSLRIGGLQRWMSEDYLYACFDRSPKLLSVVIRRNKQTGQSEGSGFINFADHATADQVLQSYNGQSMPNAGQVFSLTWATQQPGPENCPAQDSKLNWGTQKDAPLRHTDDYSNHCIFVGDLATDVTNFMLYHLFKSRYPSVKSAKIIFDKVTGHSKCYGFVDFGDAIECRQAMNEMNGAYCSTRPMRIGPVPNKKLFSSGERGIYLDEDPNNSRLFVGCLDQSVTEEDLKQTFSPYGELVDVKVLEGKFCGFVSYSERASAEEAMRLLNGSQLRGNIIRLSWGRRSANKQDRRNGGHYGLQRCYDPSGFGWPQDPYACAQIGHAGYGYHQQQQPEESVQVMRSPRRI
ncbi:hypothetical protein ACP4OV_012002 [Aristida adscensionis]